MLNECTRMYEHCCETRFKNQVVEQRSRHGREIAWRNNIPIFQQNWCCKLIHQYDYIKPHTPAWVRLLSRCVQRLASIRNWSRLQKAWVPAHIYTISPRRANKILGLERIKLNRSGGLQELQQKRDALDILEHIRVHPLEDNGRSPMRHWSQMDFFYCCKISVGPAATQRQDPPMRLNRFALDMQSDIAAKLHNRNIWDGSNLNCGRSNADSRYFEQRYVRESWLLCVALARPKAFSSSVFRV